MNTFNIFVKKAGQSLSVDFDLYPDHVKQHIIEYGLKQKFNDVHSAEEDGELAMGLVKNLQERLLRGELAKRVGTSNPVESKLKGILRKLVGAKIGGKAAEINKMPLAELVEKLSIALGKPQDKIISHFTKIAEDMVAKEQAEQRALLSGFNELDI